MRGEWLPGIRTGSRGMLDELAAAETERPDRVLLRWREGSWTVRQFADAARQVANWLVSRGIEPGERVALMAGNSAWNIAVWYGTYLAGAVELPVNIEIRGAMLAHVINDGDPAIVLASPEFAPALEAAGVTMPITIFDDALIASFAAAPPVAYASPSPGTLASIIHTSGTTGPSKGVMLGHGYFPNCAQVWSAVSEVTAADVVYWSFPFSHIDARLQFGICVMTGAVFSFVPRFSASTFWSDLETFDATWFAAVGWMASVLAEIGRPDNFDRLRVRCCAMVPVPDEAYAFFEDELGIAIIEMYGQTEANSPTFGTLRRKRRGSAGWLCAGYDLIVADDLGRELPTGQTGEILYRPGAPDMMLQGYWRREEATLAAFHDLWFHSGDLGRFDESGFLWFVGRKKDVIRRRGENISSFELEMVVMTAPGVVACAAVPISADVGGEEDVRLFVVLEPDWTFDADSFFAFCESNLPRFAQPRFVDIIAESDLVRGAGTGAVQKHFLPTALLPTTIDRVGGLARG